MVFHNDSFVENQFQQILTTPTQKIWLSNLKSNPCQNNQMILAKWNNISPT